MAPQVVRYAILGLWASGPPGLFDKGMGSPLGESL